MTRHFFAEGVQERFAQSRFDAIRELGRIAKEEDCKFMVVCGDVFESNLVDRKTVSRAIEALKDVPVPVYLLPGNHDPLKGEPPPSVQAILRNTPPIRPFSLKPYIHHENLLPLISYRAHQQEKGDPGARNFTKPLSPPDVV